MKLLRTDRWPEFIAAIALVATMTGAVLAQSVSAPEPPAVKPASPEPPASAAADNSFAIRDVRVFDGMGVIESANVVVRDGRIAAVGADVAIPEGFDAIDGTGKTLLPGLIDAHTHSWGNAQSDALRFGVTAELDMMGDARRIPSLRQQRTSYAHTAQADLWTAGAAVTAPGGHGTQFGLPVPTLAADGDAAAFVAARAKEGSDYIKIIVEDMSTHSATRRMPTIAPAQVAAAIEAAHADDRRALVHVSTQDDALHAVESGADGLVHVFVDEPAGDVFVRTAKQRGAFVVPTLSVLAGIAGTGEGAKLAADPRLQPQLSAEQIALLESSFPSQQSRAALLPRVLDSVRRLHAAGVDILAGTDAGNPGTAHGAAMHGELELLVRAGLTPSQALAAATSLPAKRFALDDRGRIASGLRADLLLVDGDPTADITATRAIARIWKNGYAIDRTLAADAKPGAAAAAAPADTLVSDFEGAALRTAAGAGWQPTTDQMLGGMSEVAHRLVEGGAQGSRGALEIIGEVKSGQSPSAMWSGMMAMLGAKPMEAVDFSARSELVFQVRGDGRTYQVMLFSGPSAQSLPSMRSFVAGPAWREVRMPLSDFAGADPKLLRAIAFAAGAPAGAFSFRIDRVEIR